MANIVDFFRDMTLSAEDKLLKELGIENPNNTPTELGIKLSQEIAYKANRGAIIEVAKKLKAEQDEQNA